MRILITGGAGFIGSAVIRHCLAHTEHTLLNVDALTYAANPDNLSSALPHPAYTFIRANVCDSDVIEPLFASFDPDAVMHLAAESHVDRSIDGARAFVETNIVGTFVLLEAARKHFAELSTERKAGFRFHHVSTDEVYGTLGETGKFSETTPYAPNSPYSASKASSDLLVRAWHKTYSLPVIITNCSNNYGPYQFPEKLLPVIVLNALAGRQIPVYGKGLNVRDWLFVEDHVEALLTVIQKGRVGETYNIGGDTEVRNIDLVQAVCSILDELKPDVSGPYHRLITYVEDRPGHDERYAIDASKISRELQWSPKTSIKDGLRQTVQWYLDNPGWVTAIFERGFKSERVGLLNRPGSN